MRCALIYPAIGSSKAYDDGAFRFCNTLKETDAGGEFELVVMKCNGDVSPDVCDALNEFGPTWFPYWGEGCDIGAHQTAANLIDHDWMICVSSHTYFHRAGWFNRMTEARELFGPGLYGGMASYEQQRPHIRTNFFGIEPKLFRAYPEVINSRVKSLQFESQPNNFLGWMQGQGLNGYAVYWDCICRPEDFRKPANVFRRGDQSNCLVWDKHTAMYANATPEEKAQWASLADKGTLP